MTEYARYRGQEGVHGGGHAGAQPEGHAGIRAGNPAADGALAASGRRSPRCLTALAVLAVAMAAAFGTAPAAAQAVKGDAQAGSKKIAMCIGCHAISGYKASFPSVYHVPMIKGQTPRYIENALTAYRSGDRDHPTMRAIAGSLTDQDIADLAAYYGSSEAK